MILIDRDDVQKMLNETDELSAYAFKILDEKLAEIPTRAVFRECDGCFGASMGDCTNCRRFVISGRIGDKLSDTVDRIDDKVDGLFRKAHRFLVGQKHIKRRAR